MAAAPPTAGCCSCAGSSRDESRFDLLPSPRPRGEGGAKRRMRGAFEVPFSPPPAGRRCPEGADEGRFAHHFLHPAPPGVVWTRAASRRGRRTHMSQPDGPPPGPDFRQGVALSELPADSPLTGHVAGEAALLVRTADGLRIVGAHCTHYGAPLAEGLVEGDTIHCPWHHACFDLRTGAATCAPPSPPSPPGRSKKKTAPSTPAPGFPSPRPRGEGAPKG